MSIKDLAHQLKPPCGKCPYKLGLVQTIINPCPKCRENGYQTFQRFRRELPADGRKSGGKGIDDTI